MLQSMGLQRVENDSVTELNRYSYWQILSAMALMATDSLSTSCSCPGPCHCDFLPGLLEKSPNLSPYCHTLSHLFSIQHPEISFRTSHNIPFLCLQLSDCVLANAINQKKKNNNKTVKKQKKQKWHDRVWS